jgi:hypothetical protein
MTTEEGELLRANRLLFLTKACIDPYVGYAERQLQLAKKAPHARTPERTALVERYGYDTKFAYHVVRLLETAVEILTEGVIRVARPNASYLIEIRNGKYSYDEFVDVSNGLITKIRGLENQSTLPREPNHQLVNDLCVRLHEMAWANQECSLHAMAAHQSEEAP